MVVTKPVEIRKEQKKYFNIAYQGEPVVVSRPRNENVVVISEEEYRRIKMENRVLSYAVKLLDTETNKKTDDSFEEELAINILEKLDEGISSEEGWISEKEMERRIDEYIRGRMYA